MEKIHSSQELSKNILQAMQIISDKRISKTQYSTTIQGIIKKCQDTSTGRYSLQYQDSIIQAYAISPSVQYSKDTLVYVFVPNGNLSEYKVILGSDKQLSVNFVENYKGQDGEYEDTGRSFIPEVNKIRLSSYQKPNSETGSPYKSLITGQLNESLAAQIKNANHLKISGIVQTNLDNSQKRKGRYGVRVVLLMKNSATGEAEQQEYYFDSNSFIGDPYNYINPTFQSVFLPFESENFEGIKSIESFVEGFPTQKDDEPIDIVITDFSINGSYKLSDQEIASVGVVLISKKGFTLKNDKDSVDITANLRVKGKPIDLKEQGAKVYWFRQDARITTSSSTYMQCGGIGWDCLNPYCSFTNYTFNATIAPTDETTFKCVIVYDNNNYFKEFEIMNPMASYDFYIESSEGTEFQYSTGHPTLTLKNKKPYPKNGKYIYKWQVRNNQNITKDLERNKSRENEIKNLKNRKDNIANNVKNDNSIYWVTKFPKNDTTAIYEKYMKIDESTTYKMVYDKINNIITNYQNYQQYVIDNVIYHVNLHEITNFSVFSCSVYKKEEIEQENGEKINKEFFVGSANITIKNTKAASLGYNLVINNGDQVFLYNEAGDSLQNNSIDEPYDISDLTYSLYYNGKKIEEKDLNGAEATWKIPSSNTLLQIELKNNEKSEEDYYTRKSSTLTFKVKNKYNSNNNNNDILLLLKYKKQVFQAKTYFTFNKQGQNGTNGTGIQFKIEMKNNKDAVLTYDKDGKLHNNNNIEPQIWENGTKIEKLEDSKVKYSILQNKDTTFKSFYSISEPNPTGNILTLTKKLEKIDITNDKIKFDKINNIIEAIYNGGNYKYYADLPIITIIEKFNHNDYRVTYKSGTGFRYVTYKNDGTKPSYNNRLPFEIKIQKNFENEWEDVTTYPKEKFTFNWKKYGNNIASVNPKDTYECSATPVKKIENSNTYNNALLLTIKKDGDVFAYVHIPIHFMLNRYENAALNDWNGSVLDIDEKGKYILAPQVGAGKKDSNNSNTFTGIVMGVEQTQGNSETQTGLFGYSKGVQTIFLNAENGNSTFGHPDKGQIQIDVEKQAIIKSSDYPQAGMQIQFSNSPHIYFGSGNFKVESNGYLYSKGGGNIAGWEISDNALYYPNNDIKEKSQGTSKIDISVVGIAPYNTFNDKKYYTGVFWAGPSETDTITIPGTKTTFAKRNFFVTRGGYLFSKFGQIAGWNIKPDKLYNSNVGMAPNNWISKPAGESGIKKAYYTGVFWAGTASNVKPIPLGKKDFQQRNFFVTQEGYLFAKSGNIAGWEIEPDKIVKNITINGQIVPSVGMSPGYEFETEGNEYKDLCFWSGKSIKNNTAYQFNFYVKSNGYLFTRYGQIGNWFIGNGGLYSSGIDGGDVVDHKKIFTWDEKKEIWVATDDTKKNPTTRKSVKALTQGTDYDYESAKGGIYLGADGIRFGTAFYVDAIKGMYAQAGEIGGIKITQDGLYTTNWQIDGSGTAHFSNAFINGSRIDNSKSISGSSGGSGISGGGMRMGSGGAGSSYMNPGVKTGPDGVTWEKYIEEAIKEATKKDKLISILKAGGDDIDFGCSIKANSVGASSGSVYKVGDTDYLLKGQVDDYKFATKSYVDDEIKKVKDQILSSSPST